MIDKLTIRDQFAMAALTGLCADPTFTGGLPKTSYNIAEEMLAEKERRDKEEGVAKSKKQLMPKEVEEKILQEHAELRRSMNCLGATVQKERTPPDEICHELGAWLSAALDDPNVCQEYKDVIERWFAAGQPAYMTPAKMPPPAKLPPDNLTA